MTRQELGLQGLDKRCRLHFPSLVSRIALNREKKWFLTCDCLCWAQQRQLCQYSQALFWETQPKRGYSRKRKDLGEAAMFMQLLCHGLNRFACYTLWKSYCFPFGSWTLKKERLTKFLFTVCTKLRSSSFPSESSYHQLFWSNASIFCIKLDLTNIQKWQILSKTFSLSLSFIHVGKK